MPLLEEQKRFIGLSINHLIDFPTTGPLLKATLKNLIAGLQHKKVEDESLAQLIKCILQPTEWLQKLEKEGDKTITVQEVRKYILELIIDELEAAAKKAQIEFLDADIIPLSAALPDQEGATPFISVPLAIPVGENPWQLIHDEETIYRAELSVVREAGTKSIFVTLRYPNTPELQIDRRDCFVQVISQEFASDAEEDRYMHNVSTETLAAESYSAAFVTTFLKTQFAITPAQEHKIYTHDYLKNILKYKIYFELVKTKRNFNFIVSLTEAQGEMFLHPMIRGLLAQKIINIHDIAQLTVAEFRIATHPAYANLMREKRLTLQEIKGITKEQSDFLINPLIASLIQLNKLTMAQVKKYNQPLSNDLLTLYATYLTTQEVDWDLLLSFTPTERRIIKNRFVVQLIYDHALSFAAIKKLHPCIKINLQVDPLLIQGISLKLYKFDALMVANQDELYTKIFATRMLAIMDSHPYVLNRKSDSIQDVLHDLREACVRIHSFINLLLPQLFAKFELSLEDKIQGLDPNDKHTQWLIHLKNILTNAALDRGCEPTATLQAIFTAVTEKHAQFQQGFIGNYLHQFTQFACSFFPSASSGAKRKVQDSNEVIKNYCERMLEIAKPLQEFIALHTVPVQRVRM